VVPSKPDDAARALMEECAKLNTSDPRANTGW
jgi:hypothetical protein